MNTPELITGKSRSEGAKRMWERRKAKGKEVMTTTTINPPVRSWVYHAEWLALMSTLVFLFLWVHNEYVHTNKRLDDHMEAINRRVDEANKRSDDLHKEFYELLKEMREK